MTAVKPMTDKRLRVTLEVVQGDNQYGQVYAKGAFNIRLPRSRDQIAELVGEAAASLIKTYTDSSMDEAKMLAETVAAKPVRPKPGPDGS